MLSFLSAITDHKNNQDGATSVENNNQDGPTSIQSIIYFLFAPTLLYRTSYPRTQKINFYNVWINFYHFVILNFCLLLIVNHQLIPTMKHFGERPITAIELINMLYKIMLISLPVLFIFFFFFFESYLNLAAELTRFADRGFYQDWWNARGPDETFRKWNTLIHDFIHEVFYKPIAIKYGKKVAMLVVFTLSAALHEYVLVLSLGISLSYLWIITFSLPMLVGIALPMHKKTLDKEGMHNFDISFHFVQFNGQIITYTALLFLYSMEFYARKNCPNSDKMSFSQKIGLKSFGLACLQII